VPQQPPQQHRIDSPDSDKPCPFPCAPSTNCGKHAVTGPVPVTPCWVNDKTLWLLTESRRMRASCAAPAVLYAPGNPAGAFAPSSTAGAGWKLSSCSCRYPCQQTHSSTHMCTPGTCSCRPATGMRCDVSCMPVVLRAMLTMQHGHPQAEAGAHATSHQELPLCRTDTHTTCLLHSSCTTSDTLQAAWFPPTPTPQLTPARAVHPLSCSRRLQHARARASAAHLTHCPASHPPHHVDRLS
jgi:hypothetical protein